MRLYLSLSRLPNLSLLISCLILLSLRVNKYLTLQYIDNGLSGDNYDPDSFYGWYEVYKQLRDPRDFVFVRDSYGYFLFGSRIIFWLLWSVTPDLYLISFTAIFTAFLILISAVITSKQLAKMGILPSSTTHFYVTIFALFPSEELYSPANLSYVLTLPLLGILLASLSQKNITFLRISLISLATFLIISKPLGAIFTFMTMGFVLAVCILRNSVGWRQLVTIAFVAFILFFHLFFAVNSQSLPQFDYFILFRLLIFCGSITLPVISHSLDNLASQYNLPWIQTVGNMSFLILGLTIFLFWYFVNVHRQRTFNVPFKIDKILGLSIAIWTIILGAVTGPEFSPFNSASHYFFSRQWFYSYFLVVIIIFRLGMKTNSLFIFLILNSFAYSVISLII